jgi:hypothetical protein
MVGLKNQFIKIADLNNDLLNDHNLMQEKGNNLETFGFTQIYNEDFLSDAHEKKGE